MLLVLEDGRGVPSFLEIIIAVLDGLTIDRVQNVPENEENTGYYNFDPLLSKSTRHTN